MASAPRDLGRSRSGRNEETHTTTDRTDAATTVVLAGALTIATVDDLRTKLLAAFDRAEAVTIDCSRADEIDLSVVQVLVAARRFAAREGRRVSLKYPASGPLLAALRRGGFMAKPGVDAFWTTGEA